MEELPMKRTAPLAGGFWRSAASNFLIASSHLLPGAGEIYARAEAAQTTRKQRVINQDHFLIIFSSTLSNVRA